MVWRGITLSNAFAYWIPCKNAELSGGIFLFAGLFTKAAASFIALTMFMATITANLKKDFNLDGGFAISYFLFSFIFIIGRFGIFSLDYLLFKKVTAFSLRTD